MCGGFRPPQDARGNTLSHRDYMERLGTPYTDEQEATRQALWAIIRAGREWVDDSWSRFTPECSAAHKAIDEADRNARLLYESAKLIPSRSA